MFSLAISELYRYRRKIAARPEEEKGEILIAAMVEKPEYLKRAGRFFKKVNG